MEKLNPTPASGNPGVPDAPRVQKVLSLLTLSVEQQDRNYYIVLYRYITHLYEERSELLETDPTIRHLFVQAVVTFMPHLEEALMRRRPMVSRIEERWDYRMLSYIERCLPTSLDGEIHRLMAELYTAAYRMNEAREHLNQAVSHSGMTIALLMAYAHYFKADGDIAKAIQMTHRAFLATQQVYDPRSHTESSAYLAYLCAIVGDQESAQRWLEQATLHRPTLAQSILLDEVRALQHITKVNVALTWLDNAELKARRFYGDDCPALAGIYFIRYLTYLRSSESYLAPYSYQSYVHYINNSYGFTPNVVVGYMVNQIHVSLRAGLRSKVDQYIMRINKLLDDNVWLTKGMVIGVDMAFISAILDWNKREMIAPYLAQIRDVCDELIPDIATQEEIAPVFTGEIPEAVLQLDVVRSLSQISN